MIKTVRFEYKQLLVQVQTTRLNSLSRLTLYTLLKLQLECSKSYVRLSGELCCCSLGVIEPHRGHKRRYKTHKDYSLNRDQNFMWLLLSVIVVDSDLLNPQ